MADFKFFFTLRLSDKFATRYMLYFPPHTHNASLHYLVKKTIAKIAKKF